MTAAAYDAIVIGSGFGGAVTACRLAEAGYRVLVLERGRRWAAADFPREPGDAWRWDDGHPERENGWIDFRIFRSMAVAQGAAVGGGSLIYANISIEATPDTFEAGWPPEVTYQELAPHYAAVGRMMNVQPVPRGQWPARTSLMHEAATATGQADRFRPLELAVNFDPGWDPAADGRLRPGPVAPLHQCRGDRAGDLRPPRGVRHRLPRPRPQHARPQLPRRGPSTTAPRSGRSTSSAPSNASGDGYRVRSDRIEARPARAGDRRGTDRRPRRGLARVDRAAAPLPRRGEDAARPARHDRPRLEQQRRLPDDRHPRRPPDRADPRPDDHERDRLPRRVRGRPSVHHRGRRVPGHRRRLAVAGARPASPGCGANGSSIAPSSRPSATMRTSPRSCPGSPRAATPPTAGSGCKRPVVAVRPAPAVDSTGTSPPRARRSRRSSRCTTASRRATGGIPIVPLSWSWLGYLITPHPLGGCNMGTDPDNERRRPPRAGLGPAQPVRRRRRDRARGARREPVAHDRGAGRADRRRSRSRRDADDRAAAWQGHGHGARAADPALADPRRRRDEGRLPGRRHAGPARRGRARLRPRRRDERRLHQPRPAPVGPVRDADRRTTGGTPGRSTSARSSRCTATCCRGGCRPC